MKKKIIMAVIFCCLLYLAAGGAGYWLNKPDLSPLVPVALSVSDRELIPLSDFRYYSERSWAVPNNSVQKEQNVICVATNDKNYMDGLAEKTGSVYPALIGEMGERLFWQPKLPFNGDLIIFAINQNQLVTHRNLYSFEFGNRTNYVQIEDNFVMYKKRYLDDPNPQLVAIPEENVAGVVVGWLY